MCEDHCLMPQLIIVLLAESQAHDWLAESQAHGLAITHKHCLCQHTWLLIISLFTVHMDFVIKLMIT